MRRLLLASVFALASVAAHAQAPVLNLIQTGQGTSKPVGTDALSVFMPIDAYFVPADVTGVNITAGATTAAVAVTMPAVVGKFNYLCSYTIDSMATAATFGSVAISGLQGGNITFYQQVGGGAIVRQTQTFTPCLKGLAVNTAITYTTFAAGAAGNVLASIQGYVR